MSVYTELDRLIAGKNTFQARNYLQNNAIELFVTGGGSFSLGHDFDVYLFLTADGELIEVGLDQGDPFMIFEASFEKFQDGISKNNPGLNESNARDYYAGQKKRADLMQKRTELMQARQMVDNYLFHACPWCGSSGMVNTGWQEFECSHCGFAGVYLRNANSFRIRKNGASELQTWDYKIVSGSFGTLSVPVKQVINPEFIDKVNSECHQQPTVYNSVLQELLELDQMLSDSRITREQYESKVLEVLKRLRTS